MNIDKFTSESGFESYVYTWDNVNEPIGVVQIIHGMADHIARYDFFAEFLNYNGFIVVGMDTRGHGKTAVEGLGLGIVTEGDSFGDTVADQIDLAKFIKEKYNLPLCLFGHSFGSFLSQSYIQRASDLLEGVILCGSAKQKGIDVKIGEIISRVQCAFCGKDKPANFITKVSFGSFDEKFAYDKMQNAWVCSNLDSVKKYNEDELCGGTASLGFFKSLFCGLKDLYEECNLDCIRKELKIFIISGDKDPVGGYGKKVKKLYETYIETGINDVSMKLYPNKRHELLNEDIRDQVMFDSLEFFKRCVIKSDESQNCDCHPAYQSVEKTEEDKVQIAQDNIEDNQATAE